MAKSTQWIVTASPDRRAASIAREMTKAGFSVDQVLDEVGSVVGSGTPAMAEKLRKVRGVVDVSPNQRIDIGPPDADIS